MHPVVVINGGPGVSHDYDLPLRQLACRGRDVIFYDQSGTGKSALPPNTTIADDFPFLLDVNYYANEELPAVLQDALHDELTNNGYHIVADSWGTMIAMKYVVDLKDNDANSLLSLVFNSPIPKSTEYSDFSWDPVTGSLGRLPDYFKSRVQAVATSGDYESEEMQELSGVVLTNAYSRNGVFTDCVMASLGNPNEEVSIGMWGPVDFWNMTGTLKDFDMYSQLHKLSHIPTLLSNGEFDMVRPKVLDQMMQHMKVVERVLYTRSGHTSIMDATGPLLDTTSDFLDRVESSLAADTDFVPRAPFSTPDGMPVIPSNTSAPPSMPPIKHWISVLVVVIVSFGGGYILGNKNRSKIDGYNSIV